MVLNDSRTFLVPSKLCSSSEEQSGSVVLYILFSLCILLSFALYLYPTSTQQYIVSSSSLCSLPRLTGFFRHRCQYTEPSEGYLPSICEQYHCTDCISA